MRNSNAVTLPTRTPPDLLVVAASPAIADGAIDPIIAAIEQHRAAWLQEQRETDLFGKLKHDDPRHEAEEAKAHVLMDATEAAALALSDIVPTTMGGVLALLAYIDEFNRGFVSFSEQRYSEYHLWPNCDLGDDKVLHARGKPLGMPFPYWIMRNVQAALERLVVLS